MYITGNPPDIRFRVGKNGVFLGNFNDPLFLKNFCWKGDINKRKPSSWDKYTAYVNRVNQVKGIGIVLKFNELSQKEKEELFKWIMQNLAQMTVGNIDTKLYDDRILLKQKVNKSNRNKNLWDAFLKFDKDNREPLAGTLKFLTHFKEAYMIVDKRYEDYTTWDPFNGIYDRNRGFEQSINYAYVTCSIKDLNYLIRVDIFEALGIRNYFAHFFGKWIMDDVEDEEFWDFFIQFAIAWCYDHEKEYDGFDEYNFSNFFDYDDFEDFRQNIMLKASQTQGFESLNNLRQYIIWNEVQYQKQKRIERTMAKQAEKTIMKVDIEEDIPF